MQKTMQQCLAVLIIWMPSISDALGEELRQSLPLCGKGNWNEENVAERRHLTWEGYQLRLGLHVLQLIDKNNSVIDQASVKQHDYGVAQSVYRSASDTLIVIGEQTSYQVTLRKTGEALHFGNAVAMPTLFRQPCSKIDQFFGACQNSSAVFNLSLGAAFIAGYDRWGSFHSYAFGMKPNAKIEFRSSRSYSFVTGLVDSIGVIFQDRDGSYFRFDGQDFERCNLGARELRQ